MSNPDYKSSPSVEVLYNDHHTWLRNWLRRRLGNAVDAADLAQDTFLRLLLKPCHFKNFLDARAYLRTTAYHLCVDLWRRREIEQAWLDVLASQPENRVPSTEHQVIVLEALYEIDAMLRSLPSKAANAFILAIACGMTDKEVARELGVSDRMVRKYIAQAMLHCMQLEIREIVVHPAGSPDIA